MSDMPSVSGSFDHRQFGLWTLENHFTVPRADNLADRMAQKGSNRFPPLAVHDSTHSVRKKTARKGKELFLPKDSIILKSTS